MLFHRVCHLGLLCDFVATLLKFHKALVKRKYRLLFSNKTPRKPGPRGPSDALIELIVEMKKRNPRFGYLRIAMQIQNAFGIKLDKGVVKRVLDKHYHSTDPPNGERNIPGGI